MATRGKTSTKMANLKVTCELFSDKILVRFTRVNKGLKLTIYKRILLTSALHLYLSKLGQFQTKKRFPSLQ